VGRAFMTLNYDWYDVEKY